MTAETQRRKRPGLKVWFLEMRAPFFTATIIPTVFGAAFAWHESSLFDTPLFLLTLLGVLCLHAGTNIVNDYFDYRSGTDRINKNRSPFNGGSPFVVDGILTPKQIYRAAMAFFAAGAIIGIILALSTSLLIIPLGVIGIGFGYGYTAPKVHLAARGIGEIAVGLGFGPLIVAGTYLVMTGELTWSPFIAGLPIGLLIGLVLFINEFPDMDADGEVGKSHWVVRMGLAKAATWYTGLMTLTFVMIVLLWATGIYPAMALIGLLPALIAARAISTAMRNHSQFDKLINAQAKTVQIHALVGTLLTIGLVASEYL